MSSNTQLPVFTAEVPHLTEAQFNYFFGDLVQKILEKSNKNKNSVDKIYKYMNGIRYDFFININNNNVGNSNLIKSFRKVLRKTILSKNNNNKNYNSIITLLSDEYKKQIDSNIS